MIPNRLQTNIVPLTPLNPLLKRQLSCGPKPFPNRYPSLISLILPLTGLTIRIPLVLESSITISPALVSNCEAESVVLKPKINGAANRHSIGYSLNWLSRTRLLSEPILARRIVRQCECPFCSLVRLIIPKEGK